MKTRDEILESATESFIEARENGDSNLMKYFLMHLEDFGFHQEAEHLLDTLPLPLQTKMFPDVAHRCEYDYAERVPATV